MEELFLVIRIKHCPVRGLVKIVESMPLPHGQAWTEKLFLEQESPGHRFFCEEITAAEAEFLTRDLAD